MRGWLPSGSGSVVRGQGGPGAGNEGASVGGLTAFRPSCPARASKTPGPGPRERRRVWPPICLEGVSQRLPQPVGGRGALPSRSHTLAKVRALRRLCCQGNRLQFTIAVSRERAAGNGSVSQQARHPEPEASVFVLCPGRDSFGLGIGV